MAEIMQAIFVNPPITIARLDKSTTPQEAYRWVQTPTPRSSGETTVKPDWTLVVQSDGSVEPVMPDRLQFRDGALIRRVCPFFEVWALLGEPASASATWREVPVTPKLLAQHGGIGGRIVAETFHRAIKGSNISMLRDLAFKPSLEPSPGVFRMTDLLQIAYDAS